MGRINFNEILKKSIILKWRKFFEKEEGMLLKICVRNEQESWKIRIVENPFCKFSWFDESWKQIMCIWLGFTLWISNEEFKIQISCSNKKILMHHPSWKIRQSHFYISNFYETWRVLNLKWFRFRRNWWLFLKLSRLVETVKLNFLGKNSIKQHILQKKKLKTSFKRIKLKNSF